ncbi:MAG TPA: hypothetical protein ENK33_01325 [Desulfobacterales bacterium]|nr:hypothetical protein [Desulfobacterales bacterium]
MVLTLKETKDIFFSKTALLFLVLVSFIVGYGFVTAVGLYSEQSLAAVNNPLYARGFEPVPGVFGPIYGGLFILFSLFLPFVIIPLISLEKEHNTLAILIQLPFSFKDILTAKIIATLLFLLFVLILTFPGIILWRMYGGHIPVNEICLLLSGYLLYGMFVVSVSFFSASLFNSVANASIFSIFLIILSWVIDFSRNMNISPLLSFISEWTVTRVLKYFENGILSFTAAMYFVLICSVFFIMAYILLSFDLKDKWKPISSTIILFLFAMFLISHITLNADMTESHRNSFPPGISKALEKVPDLEIDIYMNKGDSRFADYQKSFLKKLELIRNDVRVKIMTGKELKKKYGLFVYKINGKSKETYSNSEQEIFPIIFGLAGISAGHWNNETEFPGYPLVVKERLSIIEYIYYLLIPLGMVFAFAVNNLKLLRRLKK